MVVKNNGRSKKEKTDHGDELQEFRKAVDDGAGVVLGLWLSYLFLLFYLAIAAGAVTHVDLLLKNPVKLPFLNIELPLLAFFALAPVLFIITHGHTLVHFVMLAAKVKSFHDVLHVQFPNPGPARTAMQCQLPSNIFVQFLAGSEEIRDGGLGQILKAIAWMTIVLCPILLLLLLQVRFLPYHDSLISWSHRIAVGADIMLLWMLWPAVLEGRSKLQWPNLRFAKTAAGASLALVWFSWIVATFPDEWPQSAIPQIPTISLHKALFVAPPNVIERSAGSLLTNTLILPGINIFDAQKIDDPKKVDWRQYFVDLRGRQLQGAVFISADLTKADLTGAHLEGAFLTEAKLQGASLSNAQLQGAWLKEAQLQGASLERAPLQGASLQKAQLQGAAFNFAHLDGAHLEGAQLQGATLDFATLASAVLNNTQLQGVSLREAHVHDISIGSANLSAADLTSTYDGPKTFDKAVLTDVLSVEGQQLEKTLPKTACKPTNGLPRDAQRWLDAIAGAVVDETSYGKSLAEVLFRLVWSDKAHSIDILRAIVANPRIEATKQAAPPLIGLLASGACPLASKLTADDVAMLKAYRAD